MSLDLLPYFVIRCRNKKYYNRRYRQYFVTIYRATDEYQIILNGFDYQDLLLASIVICSTNAMNVEKLCVWVSINKYGMNIWKYGNESYIDSRYR